jgi:bifunctional non-homologous end joining protein LigD
VTEAKPLPRDPFARLSGDERALLRPAPLPERVEPMKAVLTEERFSDPAWLFERKLDGIRCIAIKGDGDARLLSRNDLSLDARFPEIAAALTADPARNLVLDGEVVAFSGGQTSFERLQQRAESHAAVYLYAFDILYLAGHGCSGARSASTGPFA